jgi:hypothetical protein
LKRFSKERSAFFFVLHVFEVKATLKQQKNESFSFNSLCSRLFLCELEMKGSLLIFKEGNETCSMKKRETSFAAFKYANFEETEMCMKKKGF